MVVINEIRKKEELAIIPRSLIRGRWAHLQNGGGGGTCTHKHQMGFPTQRQFDEIAIIILCRN